MESIEDDVELWRNYSTKLESYQNGESLPDEKGYYFHIFLSQLAWLNWLIDLQFKK